VENRQQPDVIDHDQIGEDEIAFATLSSGRWRPINVESVSSVCKATVLPWSIASARARR
jgi:hypothetical protein